MSPGTFCSVLMGGSKNGCYMIHKRYMTIISLYCRSIVFDHSIISLPALDCWLMSAESALQGSLDDFIVTQL